MEPVPFEPYNARDGPSAATVRERIRTVVLVHAMAALNDDFPTQAKLLARLEGGGDVTETLPLIQISNPKSVALHQSLGRYLASPVSRPLANALLAYPNRRVLGEDLQNQLGLIAVSDLLDVSNEERAKLVKPISASKWMFGENASKLMKRSIAEMPIYDAFYATAKRESEGEVGPETATFTARIGAVLFLVNYLFAILPHAPVGFRAVSVFESYSPSRLTLSEFPIHPFARAMAETLWAAQSISVKEFASTAAANYITDFVEATDLKSSEWSIPFNGEGKFSDDRQDYADFFEDINSNKANSPLQTWTCLDGFIRHHIIASLYLLTMFGQSTVSIDAPEAHRIVTKVQHLMLGQSSSPPFFEKSRENIGMLFQRAYTGARQILPNFYGQQRFVLDALYHLTAAHYTQPSSLFVRINAEQRYPSTLEQAARNVNDLAFDYRRKAL